MANHVKSSLTSPKNNKSNQPNTARRYECTISFATDKNLKKVFQEKKFLRIITLNNMIEGLNNIFIIRDNEDIEASIGNLDLECASTGEAARNIAALNEKIKQLEAENKRLNTLLNKLGKIFDEAFLNKTPEKTRIG